MYDTLLKGLTALAHKYAATDTAVGEAADLAKRYGAAHKMAVHKAMHHLSIAKMAHAKGMSSLKKAAGCMVAAHKANKAAVSEDAAGHVAAAHDHFNNVGNAIDDVEAHLGKAMSAWGHSTNVDPNTDVGGSVNIPALSELTEGDVPWYDSAEPYSYGTGDAVEGKFARAVAGVLKGLGVEVKAPAAKSGRPDMVTRAQAEEMVKAAAADAAKNAEIESLKKQVEFYSRQPAGPPKVRTFDFTPPAVPGAGDLSDPNSDNVKVAKIFKGIDVNTINDKDHLASNSGKMIANMIGDRLANGGSFGKSPIFDPTFRGAAGRGNPRNATAAN